MNRPESTDHLDSLHRLENCFVSGRFTVAEEIGSRPQDLTAVILPAFALSHEPGFSIGGRVGREFPRHKVVSLDFAAMSLHIGARTG